GQGVKQDDFEAVKWFRKAAEQGYAEAKFNLGHMYSKGRGVKQDDFEAVNWYRKAAEQGDADAQAILGFLYLLGERGVQVNKSLAKEWF
ncbi:tetratricopeptide repeat protein, partial [Haemophilus influenzae]